MSVRALSHITRKPASSALRLLIVDDDEDILNSTRDILELEDESFVIETASFYDQALIRAEEFEPDIALLDIKIGADNGIDQP